MEAEPVSLARDFFDAENERDWERWAGFFHPHVRYRVVGELWEVRGRDDYVRHMQEAYSRISDWRFRVIHIFGDEGVVIAELDGSGHFTGEHRGQRIHGAALRLASVCVLEFRDGKIYRVREYLDASGEDRQLAAAMRRTASS